MDIITFTIVLLTSISFVLLLDSLINLLLNLKSERKDNYLKVFLVLFSVFLFLVISDIIFFTQTPNIQIINEIMKEPSLQLILTRFINLTMGIMCTYGVILTLYSGFLKIIKKPNALKTLLRGIFWIITSFIIVFLLNFIVHIDYS